MRQRRSVRNRRDAV